MKSKRLFITGFLLLFALSASAKKNNMERNDGIILRVGSYNIRRAEMGEKLPENNWSSRKNRCVASIVDCGFDICGLQEVDLIQQMDLSAALDSAGKAYGAFFFNPYADDGKGSKSHGFIWRRDRFCLEGEPHCFWLSYPPDVKQVNDHGAKGNNKFIRGGCCAILKEINSKRRYFIMVTHAHLNKSEHAAAAPIFSDMEKRYNPRGYPSFFVGDFNALDAEESSVTYRKWWTDTYLALDSSPDSRLGPEGTYNGWHIDRKPTKRIDYIYFRGKNVIPVKYHCNDVRYDGLLPSDHYPIYADFLIYNKMK